LRPVTTRLLTNVTSAQARQAAPAAPADLPARASQH
jgi:hypothetical protein